jgi:AcrR family transcriptional regulator
MTTDKAVVDETLTSKKILDVARDQVRRFSEAKTNVVDIARALGTSHTTIYRHFRSKAEVFDAIVGAAMQDEEELARTLRRFGRVCVRTAGRLRAGIAQAQT